MFQLPTLSSGVLNLGKAEKNMGKLGDANGLLVRLTTIKEQSQGSDPRNGLNSILNEARIRNKKQEEQRERLKGLSATLDSLLAGRSAKRFGWDKIPTLTENLFPGLP